MIPTHPCQADETMTKPATLPGPGKRELQKEARRVAIIDAALEEFTTQGFTATKLDDVAVRAGIGKGTIYLYFDSKEKLFEEVVRRNLLPGREIVEAFVNNFEGSAADLLATHFRNIYCFMQNEKIPPLVAMVLGEAARFPTLSRFFHEEMIRGSQDIMRRIIQRGVQSGEFRASATDVYTQLLIAPALTGAIWNLQFREVAPIDMHSYAECHIDFILRALRA
jgi:AcrR family transcriptional regulator